jgi:hypothetical protein
MNKLDAYKQAKADLEFAKETVNKLHEVLRFYGTVTVGNSISINSSSSDKKFVYSVGILNNQINACKELGLDPQEYEESKATVIQLRATSKDLVAWTDYSNDLYTYVNKIHNLLDKDDLFKLIEIPVKP